MPPVRVTAPERIDVSAFRDDRQTSIESQKQSLRRKRRARALRDIIRHVPLV